MTTVFLSPVGGAGWQFFDKLGNPLANGTLVSYEAGTSTPWPTWTSSTGLVQNAGAIALGPDGRPVNSSASYTEVWLQQGIVYKFVLLDQFSNVIWTFDNIYGINDISVYVTPPLLPSLSSSTSYANDAAAAGGGVPVGQLYRNGSVVQIRVS